MTNSRLLIRFVMAVALAGVVAGAHTGMQAVASPAAGFATLPNLKHGEGDVITIAIAEAGFPNVTYSVAEGVLPPGISLVTTTDVNRHTTGLLTGRLARGVGNTNPASTSGYEGSEGLYTLRISSSDGSLSNPFTWDVGRWGSGDVFVGAGDFNYKVYSEDGVFKEDIVMPDRDLRVDDGTGTLVSLYGGTAGCAANWHSGEVWTTNLDDRMPALNVITRHAVDPVLPYTDATRRLATDWYLPAISPYSVDLSPESVAFDNKQNMYVGHTAGFADKDGNAADVNGNPTMLWQADGSLVIVDAKGVPYVSTSGQMLPYDQWTSPAGYYEEWINGVSTPLLNAKGNKPIPVHEGYGGDLQIIPLGLNGYSNAVRSFFHLQKGQSGTDEIELKSDGHTLLYTSESLYVYQYDVNGTGTQLPVLGSASAATPTPISGRVNYGFRVLPPGDGTGGYLMATEAHIARLDANGRVVQTLGVKDDPAYTGDVTQWFSIAVAPDGRSFWAANRQDVYRIDIASGQRIGNKIHATDGLTHTKYELAALCVMNEYRAAQENCGANGQGNTLDDDEDGVVDEGCFRIEMCSMLSPGDDDGDGLADYNDPDCGATTVQECAATGPTDASVAGFCARANHEGDAVVVPSVPLPCPGCADWTYNYTATGLPPGLTINPGTGEITGTPLYSIVNPNSASSPPQVYTVTVNGSWTQTGQTPIPLAQTFTWTVYNTNRAPIAGNDLAAVVAGGSVQINVPFNDSDLDGDPFTVLSFTQPADGRVTQVGQQLQYDAPVGFSGVATFTYQVVDNYSPAGVSNVATVTVTVNGPPVARNDSYQVVGGTTLTVTAANGVIRNAAGSDSDPEGQTVTVVASSVTAPAHGVVTVGADGSFTYTPTIGFSGTDTFTYKVTDGASQSNVATVTILVTPAPVANNDTYTTAEDTPLTIAAPGILRNDTNPTGGALSVVAPLVTLPAHGTVTQNADGSLVYTPSLNYNGTDSYTYKVKDAAGSLSNTATVTITITPVNDPPVAVNDSATTPMGVPVTVNVLGNDTDPDGDLLTVTAFSNPTTGTVTQSGNQLVFTPAPGFTGVVTFTYTISESNGGTSSATVTITVRDANLPPVAVNDTATTAPGSPVAISVLTNDSDPGGDPLTVVSNTTPLHGTLTLTAGVFIYTPTAGFSGTDTFTYTISDGRGGFATATVTITVVPSACALIAKNDAYVTNRNHVLAIVAKGLLLNDVDPYNRGIVVSEVNGSAAKVGMAFSLTRGALKVNADGSFTYTPTAGATGVDTFTYKVKSAFNGLVSNAATVTITIAGHFAGDGCDHDRKRENHKDGDHCDHDKSLDAHHVGDGCDHDVRKNGHHEGDGCSHDRDVNRPVEGREHFDGDSCSHDRDKGQHKDGDGCDHDRQTQHHNDGDNCDHERGVNGHFAEDGCQHDRERHGHDDGDGCDHDRKQSGHYDGDRCEHDLHRADGDDSENNPCIVPGSDFDGRMTGGGTFGTQPVTHGFELHCDRANGPNNLEVNWGNGNKFHLEALTSAVCSFNPNIDARQPYAAFNTYEGTGTGRYNNYLPVTATWTFTDAGEPGNRDTATIVIKDMFGRLVLSASGSISKGNQQAHGNVAARPESHSYGDSDDHHSGDADDVDGGHHSGDHCDHDRNRSGHHAGDGCDHDRIVKHFAGDACDHDKNRVGHKEGDRCDHDRAMRDAGHDRSGL